MPAPLDYGSADHSAGYDSGDNVNPWSQPRVFRRRTTVVISLIFAVAPLLVAALVVPKEASHGALNVAATLWGALTLSLFALVMGVWPHVKMDAERMQVQNSFFWFDIPYVSVSQVRPIHLGVVIRTHAGKVVPVAAYASGSGKRIFAHKDAAEELKRAVEERTAYVDDTAWKTAPPPERHANWLNIIGLLGAVAIAVVLIIASVQ